MRGSWRAAALLGATLVLAGCVPAVAPAQLWSAARPEETPGTIRVGEQVGDPVRGRALFVNRGCGACHRRADVPEAFGTLGPDLTGLSGRRTLAGGALDNEPETLRRWIRDPEGLKPGTAMPTLGLTDQQAADLAAFLLSP